MKESPIQATIGFVIDILGLRPENFDGAIETPAVISDIPGIEDLPPNVIDVPEGGFGIFPLPRTCFKCINGRKTKSVCFTILGVTKVESRGVKIASIE